MKGVDVEGAFAPRYRAPRWYERFPRGLPVGIFLLTMAVTGISVSAIERAESQRERAQLSQTAQTIASGLERRANASAAYLRSGAALFATQQVVPAPLFRTFISELRLGGNFLGADGIGWAMKVDRKDIATVEQAMRRQGGGDFHISPLPAGNDDYAVPVMYLQPDTARNRRAIGYNMFSEPARRAAMIKAASSGRPTASGKVVLLQEGQGRAPGFLIYMPVYSTSGSDRARKLRGYVYSPFNARTFVESAIDTTRLGAVGVRLYDGDPSPDNLLAEFPVSDPSDRIATRRIRLANDEWTLEVQAQGSPVLGMMSVVTLLFGLLVATLLMVLSRLATRQAAEDRLALAWFEQQSSIRNSLTRELNHRVKNTLANVLSIITLTKRRATDLDSFADSLEGRIRALSATHDLLTQSGWGSTPVEAVIRAEMAPYAQDIDRHLVLNGPEVELAPNDALSLGLAIHELATNAAKYGALSVEGGSVAVNWELVTGDLARIEWIERGGPPIDPAVQRKRGFGTDLIEKIVAHELRNPVDLRFTPEGVRCSLFIPVRVRQAAFALREKREEG
ncbi:CHASE domain-containing protein [Novosphingobium sp. ZN18A2]|uniref:CHASE domain-containing protein n=1 Tax=Novosphingobium sp. ZN18A2 TaxID=3079861 RepID=UPI0030D15132